MSNGFICSSCLTPFRFGVIVPTYNAGQQFTDWVAALKKQTLVPDHTLIIDSSSVDKTEKLAREAGFSVVVVPLKSFNHGSTRQFGVESMPLLDVVIFLTQDAFLANDKSLATLLNVFRDESIGAAYGRQVSREDANPIETHARIFNYPPEGKIKSLADSKKLGIKTCFMSNSFAAYRVSALQQIGGFPEKNIVSEDTYVAAKILEAGWKIKYCAEATVYHSHNYSMLEEFQRYFDIGVFHSREPWIRQQFGQAEGEGQRFVKSQIGYLKKDHIHLIPSVLLRTAFKYIGFRLGFCEAYLPNRVKMWLSMQKHFWK